MRSTKKSKEPAITPVVVRCKWCDITIALGVTMCGICPECIASIGKPLPKFNAEKARFPICQECNVEDGTVEKVSYRDRSGTWLCRGCRTLNSTHNVEDPVYDPVADAPLELSRGVEKELQQALEDSLKFDGDVVSKTEHDAEVAALKEESDHYKRLLTRMLVGYVRNGSSFDDSCTITSPVILETVPLSAISFVEDTLNSLTPTQNYSRLAIKIDPAYDPRVEKKHMAPWETEEKLKIADEKFNEVFFKPLKTVVDERTKRVSLSEPTEPPI